jgi:hypothetical protein
MTYSHMDKMKPKRKKKIQIFKSVEGVILKDITAFGRAQGVGIYLFGTILFAWIAVRFIEDAKWYSTPASLLTDLVIFYIWHVQAHYRIPWLPFNDVCHRVHHYHHYNVYPPNDFYGSKYHTVHKRELVLFIFSDDVGGLVGTLQNDSFGLLLSFLVLSSSSNIATLPVPFHSFYGCRCKGYWCMSLERTYTIVFTRKIFF